MTLFDAIIVGSGPAGTFAAYAMRNHNVLMLDVGFNPPVSNDLDDNIFRLRQKNKDMFHSLIGNNFENLRNIHEKKVSLKVKSPYMSYVIKDWEKLSPVISDDFEGVLSFAKGGLANAWGAGVYRFNDDDLKDFPIMASDLSPYYDQLTDHIGISGQNDDLEQYFGHDDNLMAPMILSRFATEFLKNYHKNRSYFNSRGIFVGMPRLAVLTRDHNGREAYRYDNSEFFKPCIPAVYTPAYTLNQLINEGSIQYKDQFLVTAYRENKNHVDVSAKNLRSGEMETFRAKKLILAAGALSTAKIVLSSNDDFEKRLLFLDNPMAVMFLLHPASLGSGLEFETTSLTQLNIIYRGPLADNVVQASLYGTSGPLRSDALFELPMTISSNMKIIKYVAQSSGALMLFYPGRYRDENYIKLTPENALEVHCKDENPGAVEHMLIHALRKIGFYSAESLCQRPKIGSGLHYAGLFPMRNEPGRYQTDRNGRLFGARNVFIADGACFSALPSKNLTFTIMANSMRIADYLKRELRSS